MTVQELINQLEKIENKEISVMVNGYEGGLDDMNLLTETRVILNTHEADSYLGRHEELDNPSLIELSELNELYEEKEKKLVIVGALILTFEVVYKEMKR